MTTLIRYNPWALTREVSRVLASAPAPTAAAATWTPPVDIAEYEDRFVLTADLPGVEPSAIEVTLDNGVLTLSGQRGAPARAEALTDAAPASASTDGDAAPATTVAPAAPETPTRRRTERATGRFSRRFTLPDTVDVEQVAARNSHGVLEITIPKRPQAQARKIAVVH